MVLFKNNAVGHFQPLFVFFVAGKHGHPKSLMIPARVAPVGNAL
jgi:hypothetical protein